MATQQEKLIKYFISLIVCLSFSCSAFAELPELIQLDSGLIQGDTSSHETINIYRGIPFASAPTGENRWRAPQAVASWSGTRDATEFGPRCVQGGFQPGSNQALTSEDCLYLNVYTPANSSSDLLPVMIWIHGGGFFTGSASNDIYDGTNLASKDVIVVTINYRLGSFGFLAHPELSAESSNNSSGHYAMMDMVAAIKWVNRNIQAFGGNSENITIFGESAGSASVASLIASPLTENLFQRAILQSGAWMGLSIDSLPTLNELEQQGATLVEAFGASSIEELRHASTLEIFENFPNGGAIGVDGYFLPEDPSLIYSQNQQHKVDVLVGSNENESAFFGPGIGKLNEFVESAQNTYGELANDFLDIYPADSDQQANAAYHKSYNNSLAWQMRQQARYQESQGKNAYVYFFTHIPPGQEATGATHVSELAYVFNQHQQNENWNETDKALGDMMATYWANFAKRGNPNGVGLPTWPVYTSHSKGKVQVLGDIVETETEMVPSQESLDFFQRAYQQHLLKLQ